MFIVNAGVRYKFCVAIPKQMTALQYRDRLDRLLFLVKHQQMECIPVMTTRLGYSISTIERHLKRLRAEGHVIAYDRSLKRYVLAMDEPKQRNLMK